MRLHRHPSIHAKNLAGNIAGLITGEERHRPGNILNATDSVHGYQLFRGFYDRLGQLSTHLCIDKTWSNAIRGNVLFSQLAGNGFGFSDKS